jgi:hypothetical protein
MYAGIILPCLVFPLFVLHVMEDGRSSTGAARTE